MSITTRKGGREPRWLVRTHLGGGKQRHVGTYNTREAAEEADTIANGPSKRKCANCGERFRPLDDRRVTCDTCLRVKPKTTIDDHWLYRCFAADDSLLYIGITSTGLKRFRIHGGRTTWWPNVATIKVEHYATAAQAHDAEVEAIKAEQPLHNRNHNERVA